jgi:DinB superfamily
MSNLVNRIAEATEARQRLLDCAHRFTTDQAAFKPSPGVWSIAENVEHLVLAEQGSVNRVWNAAESLRAGKALWTGDAVHRGRTIEEIVNTTWVQGQEAPDLARPRRGGPLSYWMLALQCNQPLLEALPGRPRGLSPEEVITPHPISGSWDADQWIAFVRFHLDLHRAQIEEVSRASDFPDS